jgi:hypothetical protein
MFPERDCWPERNACFGCASIEAFGSFHIAENAGGARRWHQRGSLPLPTACGMIAGNRV